MNKAQENFPELKFSVLTPEITEFIGSDRDSVLLDLDFSPYNDRMINSLCHAWSCTPSYFIRKYVLKK